MVFLHLAAWAVGTDIGKDLSALTQQSQGHFQCMLELEIPLIENWPLALSDQKIPDKGSHT